ncbi:pyrimidine-nucleoside phosphorylase [Desulfuribacillus stibiiarsenatis]|uniref:Pyrimidine-nucleoside phosphorylase n=1 Tax=Desulfuribacillus stibiiarsenatis TaxID=1390249 RepID=A0A1E5L6F5_9FIRM|nr:pyrimidine-nucleoside phosphorylase [Desulfuribacillus stibiiarsenatis]OEH85696.1 pyrimidine-nucleoside phosphorylase [Desulfuribacillus stibiiarsenatis]
MRMYDIIVNKRDGLRLTEEEIHYFIQNYVHGKIPDYQISALLMAIYLNGMTSEETAQLTLEMVKSGDTIDLSRISGLKVDKHSTGGVGDKATLIVAPIVAACGLPVAKMSGRGLGHTGGTIDKLESVTGFRAELTVDQFIEQVNEKRLAIVGQSGNLTPADKKLYALRDVTATVDSIPLIASSIMSKKIAAGADAIVLDVKVGSGAFMKTFDEAVKLSKEMVAIGENLGRSTVAIISDMDQPLGYAVGNSLEVYEAIQTLKGNGPQDLLEVCIKLSSYMLLLGQLANNEGEAEVMATQAIDDGSAYACFLEFMQAQGADLQILINQEESLISKENCKIITAKHSGFIQHISASQIGHASMILGAGRETKESAIDYFAGVRLLRKPGEFVQVGEQIAEAYSTKADIGQALSLIQQAYIIGDHSIDQPALIKAIITKREIESRKI